MVWHMGEAGERAGRRGMVWVNYTPAAAIWDPPLLLKHAANTALPTLTHASPYRTVKPTHQCENTWQTLLIAQGMKYWNGIWHFVKFICLNTTVLDKIDSICREYTYLVHLCPLQNFTFAALLIDLVFILMIEWILHFQSNFIESTQIQHYLPTFGKMCSQHSLWKLRPWIANIMSRGLLTGVN